MPILVKICGLKTPDALDAALDAGADMVGFVFFPPSPRNVGIEAARTLGERVKNRATKVALSVNATDAELAAVVEALKPGMLQLHGQESPKRVMAVKAHFGLPIMKALPIETKSDFSKIDEYRAVSDWILFDARAPSGATRPGGLGRPFDWSLLRGAAPGIPFVLSGGLNAENVGEALAITLVPAVDVSSGVERALGVKDPEKIRNFIQLAREAHTVATTYPYRVSI